MLKKLFKTDKSFSCLIGFHRGKWKYEAPDTDTQIKVCDRCGIQSRRTMHAYKWVHVDHPTRDCIQELVCSQCGRRGYGPALRHTWGELQPGETKWAPRWRKCIRCGEVEVRQQSSAP
jgi:hypothetical protein